MEKIETFSQPILKLENHFAAISNLGDHFIAIWKFENHLATNSHFRSKWRIWHGVAMGLRKHFAAKWDFRIRVPFSQPISQLRNGVGRLRNGALAAKFSLSFACSSSNGHNFFVSTSIYTPFEALDSRLPELQNEI